MPRVLITLTGDACSWGVQGQAHMQMENYGQAKACYGKALELDPRSLELVRAFSKASAAVATAERDRQQLTDPEISQWQAEMIAVHASAQLEHVRNGMILAKRAGVDYKEYLRTKMPVPCSFDSSVRKGLSGDK